ncbi:hypothetical protein J437_LFUL012880 [Ladona fulva]|uniref:Uncharacterized protein n=1 Tax=Ladona fulva TaxID=123851 RepID=A0A8K0JZY0_LADFU|nr:hypothetical protein J437_LFUL012880 [Ladona fulva]
MDEPAWGNYILCFDFINFNILRILSGYLMSRGGSKTFITCEGQWLEKVRETAWSMEKDNITNSDIINITKHTASLSSSSLSAPFIFRDIICRNSLNSMVPFPSWSTSFTISRSSVSVDEKYKKIITFMLHEFLPTYLEGDSKGGGGREARGGMLTDLHEKKNKSPHTMGRIPNGRSKK